MSTDDTGPTERTEPTEPTGPTGMEDLVVPDDLSGLVGGSTDPDLAVLVTQVAGAEPLAAACALVQVTADVVPTDIGALAVLAERAGGAPQRAAAALTTLVQGVPLILVERRGEQLTMVRWSDGAAGDQLAPGLVLGSAPEQLEDLLTGAVTVGELEGVVASSSISRWRAMRVLGSAARRARRKESE